jgi:hypothetical protein
LPKASTELLAMIVLSRSKNAAAPMTRRDYGVAVGRGEELRDHRLTGFVRSVIVPTLPPHHFPDLCLVAPSCAWLRESSVSLLVFWSPKGGTGTSVTAAAVAIQAATFGPVRLVDLSGDQPAVLGLGADPDTGVADWLALGPIAPTDALERLAVPIVDRLVLVPRGSGGGELAPRAEAEAGAALGVALRDGPLTIVDAGVPHAPAARGVVEVADASFVVLRECYLALRRAAASPLTARAYGLVVHEEPGRALGVSDVASVLGRPVVARVAMRSAVARAVDAGVLPTRLPDALAKPAASLLRDVGVVPRGAAA